MQKGEEMCVCGRGPSMTISVLHLLKELVGWVLVTVLLHLGQVALFWGDGSIHLQGSRAEGWKRLTKKGKSKTISSVRVC